MLAVIPNLDDEVLLERYVLGGDREAMGQLFMRHADFAYQLACRLLKQSADAEDAVQTAFIEILRNAASYDPCRKSTVKAWMTGFVINTCQHKLRERSRRSAREQFSTDASEPTNYTDDAEILSEVRTAVDELPDPYRMPLWLHYIEGLPVNEVAEALGTPPDTVRKQLSRGLERVRSRLAACGIAAFLPVLSELKDALPAVNAPASLMKGIRTFAERGTWPSPGMTALNSGRLAVKFSTRWAIGAVIAVSVVAVAVMVFNQPAVLAPAPAAAIAPVQNPAKARSGPVYESDFATGIGGFWEKATPRDKVRVVNRGIVGPALQIEATPADRDSGGKNAGTELVSRSIDLNGMALEISITRLRFEVAGIDNKARGDEFYLEFLDDRNRTLLVTGIPSVAVSSHFSGLNPFQSVLAGNVNLPVPGGVNAYCFDASGLIAEQMLDGSHRLVGTMPGGIRTLKMRFFARSSRQSSYCLSAEKIRIHRLEKFWPTANPKVADR